MKERKQFVCSRDHFYHKLNAFLLYPKPKVYQDIEICF